jgi:hypothetical protein
MGGGGGGYFSGDIGPTLRNLRAAQLQTRDEEYEAETNTLLASYLSAFNDRDRDSISRRLEEIKKALEKELDGTVDLKMGGSVSKHTYVDGLSDIDSLVMLDSCELAERSPAEAKDYLAARLSERFPKTEVTEGRLAVTVRFKDMEIQLLPAVSCRDHVKIADETGERWSAIKPREFSSALTRVNQENGGKVVPVVKLAKGIISNLPEKHRISGYHAESLAVALFRTYEGPQQPKEMLKHFFSEGAKRLNEPIRDRTGQSVHVDDYLGETGSLDRRIVSDAFARIGRRMSNADASSSAEVWRALF